MKDLYRRKDESKDKHFWEWKSHLNAKNPISGIGLYIYSEKVQQYFPFGWLKFKIRIQTYFWMAKV